MAGEGYTLEEACLLARSSLPQQRAAALRLLGCVLACSRPVAHSTPRPIILNHLLGGAADQTRPAAAATAAALDWGDIWRHALHAADVALVVRLALDDANLAVVGAAAEALVALVGPSQEGEWEMGGKGVWEGGVGGGDGRGPGAFGQPL